MIEKLEIGATYWCFLATAAVQGRKPVGAVTVRAFAAAFQGQPPHAFHPVGRKGMVWADTCYATEQEALDAANEWIANRIEMWDAKRYERVALLLKAAKEIDR